MRTIISDIRFAHRSFRSRPSFALTAIGLMGLGIGATTTIFSVVDTVLLRRLPYPNPERLVLFDNRPHSYPNFEEWSKLLYYNTGMEISPREIWTVAERAYNMERLFNIREGLTRQDDWLVDRYFDEPTRLGIPGIRGRTIDRDKFKKMIDEYYGYHGWGGNGQPTVETLKRLGIANEPSHVL